MSRRRIMSSHAPVKVAAHVLRLGGALDDGNYDIALPDADWQRAAEIPSLPQRAAFGSWQRFEKWRIFRRIELEILMLTMMMSPLAPGIKACGPIVDIDQVCFAIVDYDSGAHKVLSLENDSPLCRVGARRVALAVSSGSPRAEHVCPSRPSPNPLCKFPSDGLSRDRLSD
jgi:hypothetical protein